MPVPYSLDSRFEQLVDTLVQSGRYTSAKDVMQDGLSLLEQREQARNAKLAALRQAIDEGGASGSAGTLDMAAVKAKARARAAAKAS